MHDSRPPAQRLQGLPPFHVIIGNFKHFMQAFELGMEGSILLLLPVRSGGVAEEYPAPEWPYRVDGAQFIGLKRASAGVGAASDPRFAQLVNERRHLDGGDEQAMAEFIKPATSPGSRADWPPKLDGIGEGAMDIAHRAAHVLPTRCRFNSGAKCLAIGW